MKYLGAIGIFVAVIWISGVVTEIQHERRFPWISLKILLGICILVWLTFGVIDFITTLH